MTLYVGTVTLSQICNAVKTTLGAAASLVRSQSAGVSGEITEGMNDTPTLQVYPEGIAQDAMGSNDRSSFGADVRVTRFTINADLYVRQRAHIGEDLYKLLATTDEIIDILEAQDGTPAFSLTGIKSFSWTWQRVQFTYGDSQQPFVGGRFTITITVF